MQSMRTITVELWTLDNGCECFTVNHVSTEDAMRDVYHENETELTAEAIVRRVDGTSLHFDGKEFSESEV